MLQPERVLRFEAADRDQIERLVSSPLPLGLEEASSELDFFRDVYWDTPAGDLKDKGATLRWRVRKQGPPLLLLDVRERQLADGAIVRRRSETEIDAADPASAFASDAEPARLLRALIDPDRLEKRFELETMRRVRTAILPNAQAERLEVACDVITVRHGEFSAELYEAELRLPSGEVPVDRLLRAFRGAFGLKQTFIDTANRARTLLEDLSADALSHALRASREVALIAYDRGAIALRDVGGSLIVPHGPGAGADACRRAMREAFG
ncbi:MAG: CYTH domain-containing protein, partial [Longimicrobiales bacterium]